MIKKLLSLLVLTLLAASCANEMDTVQTMQQRAAEAPVFYATIEGDGGADTKVYADEKARVLWNADDRISIFNKSTGNEQYRFDGKDGANSGKFSRVTSASGTALSHIYAAYPYRETSSVSADGSTLSLKIPSEQTYKEHSFGLGANTMVSKTTDNQLKFRNVGAFLCFKLYGAGISVRSIILKSNAKEKLAGPINVTLDENGIPSMTFDSTNPLEAPVDQITLTAETPVALGATAEEAVSFWMVVPPVTLASGFTVIIVDGDGNFHFKSTDKTVTLVRNQLMSMKPFQLEEVTPQIVPEGVYYLQEPVYQFDKKTDQINIVEAEGNIWTRFLNIPYLIMFEVGPIPADVKEGDSFDASLLFFYQGIPVEDEMSMTVQYIKDGKISLASNSGYRLVTRY